MFLLYVIMKTSTFVTVNQFCIQLSRHTHVCMCNSSDFLFSNLHKMSRIPCTYTIDIEWQNFLACSLGQLVYVIANDLTVLLLLSSSDTEASFSTYEKSFNVFCDKVVGLEIIGDSGIRRTSYLLRRFIEMVKTCEDKDASTYRCDYLIVK